MDEDNDFTKINFEKRLTDLRNNAPYKRRKSTVIYKNITANPSSKNSQDEIYVKKRTGTFQKILLTLIEISSFFDFISDGTILMILGRSQHSMWFSLTIITMACPYYTCYTSLMVY